MPYPYGGDINLSEEECHKLGALSLCPAGDSVRWVIFTLS